MNIYYDVEDNQYRTYPDGDIATINQIEELIENKNLSIVKLQQKNRKQSEKIKEVLTLLENFNADQVCTHTTRLSNEIEKILKEVSE